MSSKQKLVKIFATGLAVFLIISIISGIVCGVMFLFGAFPSGNHNQNLRPGTAQYEEDEDDDDEEDDDDDYDYEEAVYEEEDKGIVGNFINDVVDGIVDSALFYSGKSDATVPDGKGGRRKLSANDFSSRSYTFQDIQEIEIDSSIYSVSFAKGDVSSIQVELTNVYNGYTVEQAGDTLKMEEPSNIKGLTLDRLFDLLDGMGQKREASISITVPENFTANKVELDGGIGNIRIEDLSTEYLEIDTGVGDIKCSRIIANTADIDGGTGNASFIDSAFGNTDIDCGVGNVTFSGTLHGEVSIDCGVGNTKLSLSDSRDNYYLVLEKGLGTVTLDGNKLKFSDSYEENANAPYLLDINGGVGNITIDFASSL